MNRIIIVFFMLLVVCETVHGQGVWVNKAGTIKTVDSRALVVQSDGLYLATRDCVYMSKNADGDWEVIFSLPAGEDEVTALAARGSTILVGTRKGVYRTVDGGKQWSHTLHSIFGGRCSVTCMAYDEIGGVVWVGAEKGVFRSIDGGANWQDASDNLRNKVIRKIALGNGVVYACGDGGVYKRSDRSGWERIIVKVVDERVESEEPVSDAVNDAGEPLADGAAQSFALQGARVYVGMDKHILYSDDAGVKWKDFSTQGLSGTVAALLASRSGSKLFAATDKGVYEMTGGEGAWQELYKGADRQLATRDLIFEGQDEKYLWAVTENGIYRFESGRYMVSQFQDVNASMKRFSLIATNEPTYRDLREAAIKYADVSPDKVRDWHRESRMRALLPKVSVGFDNNSSTTAEIYTSATKDYVITGPDDVTSGVDVGVSWELGDLIWSTNQTSIDVRSRLTTELRNDILDDLRRVYFERKRLQYELISMPPKDPNIRIEKEMRVQELTQAIDDLTGNYMSEHIKPM